MRLNYLSKSILGCMLGLAFSFSAMGQLKELTESLFNPSKKAGTEMKLLPADSIRRADSSKMTKLQQELDQMRINEALMRMELESTKKTSHISDSLRRVRQQHMIDSLRRTAKGLPLIVGGDTLFKLYLERGDMSLADRIDRAHRKIVELSETRGVEPDSISVSSIDNVSEVSYKDQVILVVTDNDALWENMSRDSLANTYRTSIVRTIHVLKERNSTFAFIKKGFLFILVLAFQYVLFFLTGLLFRKTKKIIIKMAHTKFKTFSIRDYELLNTSRQARILIFFANIVRYALIAVQLLFTVPMLFYIFPETKELANQIFNYILSPFKSVFMGVVNYIPSMFFILVIWLCIRYLVKGLQFVAKEIEAERLKITGFYPDWAQPTYSIVRFLMYAFMLAMIYPYLPGSDSSVFQGISVFVGLIISLGSSTVIANIMAGLVITYMRPFKIGDRIKLNETVGNVIEKTPFVTRIKTPKNEVVTIPNSFVLSSHSINYSSSARDYGLVLHTVVTVGYDVPWERVHQLLIEAAKEAEGVMQDPEPYILETFLHDFYCIYEVNAYIEDANRMPRIYSNLHQSIQSKLFNAGIEIESPALYRRRPEDMEGEVSPIEYRRKRNV